MSLDTTCPVGEPAPECDEAERPATCCFCTQFTTPPIPGGSSTFWGWYCGPPNCPAGLSLPNGCVTPSPDPLFGIPLCPIGYSENVFGSGICCPDPPPTPTPTLPGSGGGEGGGACTFQQSENPWMDGGDCAICEDGVDNDCNTLTDGQESSCWWRCISPVLLDTAGDGLRLTGGAGGVLFDFDGDGVRERRAWTFAGSDDAWLVLDRDGDGLVGDGRELFGNFTPQAVPPRGVPKNGFRALAAFDRALSGGNGDGVIDRRDAVFTRLRLWQDANHDGVAQPAELHGLPALDVARLHLDYKESRRVDEHGNRFRFRAKADDAQGARVNRWAWDVYLVAAP